MGFLPSPDSIIIIFFTLFLLTIFQYVFFFSVSSNTFKDVVINNASNIITDKFLFSKKDDILKYIGDKEKLQKDFEKTIDEKNEKNKIIQKTALKYIIVSGIIFCAVFVFCLLLILFGNYDISTIIPKLIVSVVLVILGFSTELYIYYLVIKPYKYTSKYEIISALNKKLKEKIPNNKSIEDINVLIDCIPKILSNQKCDLPENIKNELVSKLKIN